MITPLASRIRGAFLFAAQDVGVATDEGIYVSGARVIAMLGPVSDEMIMHNLPRFRAGDEDHARIFAVPMDVKVMRQISRDPYYAEARESYDHPLSMRFEENDSLLILDNVFVTLGPCLLLSPGRAVESVVLAYANMRAVSELEGTNREA
ncbi:hypothetical protein LMG28614_03795 [Paraburkholderia ultramafica]|uniref:HpaB/PvcC/4-BUDH N-terminal domain-containing protein n=1 Tax=Paraburkholderia ultramafica TaxID=1544867 RepID=A0A6S7BCQ2_9BURK|nr:4-hydroxyphenylacetate 3-hydroxylase N-terminal domain-containing protein [Paraburkholderia ultramafica]CAB3793929.1 hypothetical protein LMG28614_03795 [Paraburkholderia ultramafica]